jgi:hypothetical protein
MLPAVMLPPLPVRWLPAGLLSVVPVLVAGPVWLPRWVGPSASPLVPSSWPAMPLATEPAAVPEALPAPVKLVPG